LVEATQFRENAEVREGCHDTTVIVVAESMGILKKTPRAAKLFKIIVRSFSSIKIY
jgi:hypothetical protein